MQRGHHFAIVDEVDSILIDEARTPLIISGPAEESTDLYYEVDRIIPQPEAGRRHPGQRQGRGSRSARNRPATTSSTRSTRPSRSPRAAWPRPRSCSRTAAADRAASTTRRTCRCSHHVQQALRAHALFQLDVDYVIKDGEVVIVDEFTGRLMPGRRWSDGLHQAVEAKEKVKIERENQTLATITFQNYFRKYGKLSGMTGTADTEADEFAKIYNLDVVVDPHQPRCCAHRGAGPRLPHRAGEVRRDRHRHPREAHGAGAPCWSAPSRSRSRKRAARPLLAAHGAACKHVVLNAKYHAQEAEIVAQAGRKGDGHHRHQHGRPRHGHPARRQRRIHGAPAGARRAGRRTAAEGRRDASSTTSEFVYFYHLDGFYRVPSADWRTHLRHFKQQTDAEHDEVVALGGLHILGTERHEARRIDNQLRGRAGRQGDPGSSRFYLSLEDDLMRIFGSDRISGLMQRLGMEEGVPIEHGMVTSAIERAQKQVEAQNFSVRKHLLEYDDVMNKQRENVYALRRQILDGTIKMHRRADHEEAARTSAAIRSWSWPRRPARRSGRAVRTGAGRLRRVGSEALEREASRTFSVNVGLRRDFADLHAPIEIRRADLWAEALKVAMNGEGSTWSPRDDPATVERDVMLQIVDAQWKDHLYSARPPEGRHRSAWLRAARSPRRIQEGKLQPVPAT